MEDVNLLCGILNCSKPAAAFGIKEGVKVRSCEEHLASLLSKKLQICDITGYSFISNLHDAAEFEERKIQVFKARGNLAALEAKCDGELATALQAIESVKNNVVEAVDQRFEEIKVEVTETCKLIKNQIEELQKRFEQFLISKDKQLSPSEQLICGKLNVIPLLLRFGISDISSHISAALSICWVIPTVDIHSTLKCLDHSQKKVVIESVLAEATEYAKKGIQNALCYVDLLSEEEEFGQPQMQVLAEILKFEKKSIGNNLEWLQHAWDLRQRSGLSGRATVKVGRSLAVLLYQQFGQFASAEQILRLCHEVTQAETPLSEDSMALYTDICGIHVANAQFQQAEELGLWVLQAFAAAGLPSECYWTALFHLTDSMRQLGKQGEVTAIMEYWGNLEVGNKLSEMLRLLVYGSGVHETENKEVEGKWLLQAKRIGTSHFPTSTFTAFACFRLALVSSDSAREELHELARSIYEVVAPKTLYAIVNLTSLGEIHQKKNRFDMAEKCYRQAKSLYEITAPKSIYAAMNLTCLGEILQKKDQFDIAEDCYRQAKLIYETTVSKSIYAATNLIRLGEISQKKDQFDMAEECYRQAKSIYEIAAPKSISAAKNLCNMAAMLERKAQWSDAIDCRQQAWIVYEFAARVSIDAAVNLTKMGVSLRKKARYDEAIVCHHQAREIYEVVSPRSTEAGDNLSKLAEQLKEKGQCVAAEEYFKQAQSIYEVTAPISIDAANNLKSMAVYYSTSMCWEEAKQYFKQAQSIYEKVAPKSVDTASNLNSMALYYAKRESWKTAEKYFKQAQSIFEEVAPKSVDAANNLNSMALFYVDRKYWKAAEESYLHAQSIYEEVAPKSVGLATILSNIGEMCKVRKQWGQAEKFYKLSQSIYEEIAPHSAKAGIVHYKLGEVYKAIGQNAQALECLLKSEPILEANNCISMKITARELITQLRKTAK